MKQFIRKVSWVSPLIFTLFLFSCTNHDKEDLINNFNIAKINSLSTSGKTKPVGNSLGYSYKNEMFLVEGWSTLTEEDVIWKLDSFVQDSFAKDMQDFDLYQILFIRKSHRSNKKDLEKFSENLFNNYSSQNDLLATYQWNKGVFKLKEYDYKGSRYPNIIDKGD